MARRWCRDLYREFQEDVEESRRRDLLAVVRQHCAYMVSRGEPRRNLVEFIGGDAVVFLRWVRDKADHPSAHPSSQLCVLRDALRAAKTKHHSDILGDAPAPSSP